jgi:hypothetical protein
MTRAGRSRARNGRALLASASTATTSLRLCRGDPSVRDPRVEECSEAELHADVDMGPRSDDTCGRFRDRSPPPAERRAAVVRDPIGEDRQ